MLSVLLDSKQRESSCEPNTGLSTLSFAETLARAGRTALLTNNQGYVGGYASLAHCPLS